PGPAAGRRAGQRPAPASAQPDHRLRRRRRLLIRPLVRTPGSDPLLRPRGQTPDSDPLLRPFTPTPVSGACDVPMAAARFECIPLPEGQLHLAAGWLGAEEADALFETLRAQVPWEVHRIRIFGREVDSPRLSCWIGDPDASYVYSRTRFEPRPWLPALLELRERLHADTGARFNSVLANLYRSGADAMGWHADDEPELGA